jgi:hypothetical protein
MVDAVIRTLEMALAMGWQILWPLILGFSLSAVVLAAVSSQQMSQPTTDTPTAMLISWTIRLLNHRHWNTGTAAPGRRSP